LISLEQPKNLETYVKKDEVIFSAKVNKIEAKISGVEEAIFYGHREESMDALMDYIANNAPGVDNDAENKGNGYDRVALLKNVSPEKEAEFLEFLQTQEGADFIYEFATNNCSSHTIELINEFFGDIIKDKTKVDRPNNEFNKIKKDTDNWEVLKDDKEKNDEQRQQN
jgi:hypothetical protein